MSLDVLVTRVEGQGQLRGCTSNSSTGDLSSYFFLPVLTCSISRYLASKGKVASELMAEEVKEEEKNFLKESYPGLMGSPVQVAILTSISYPCISQIQYQCCCRL